MEGNKLYVIRSLDGKYYKSKGYRGYGDSWRKNINEAKIYTKIGPARAQVTWWATNYPDYGTPDLIEITVMPENMVVLNEESRIEKVKARKAKEKERRIESNARYKANNWWANVKGIRQQMSLVKTWLHDTDQDKENVHLHPDDLTQKAILEMYKFHHPNWRKSCNSRY